MMLSKKVIDEPDELTNALAVITKYPKSEMIDKLKISLANKVQDISGRYSVKVHYDFNNNLNHALILLRIFNKLDEIFSSQNLNDIKDLTLKFRTKDKFEVAKNWENTLIVYLDFDRDYRNKILKNVKGFIKTRKKLFNLIKKIENKYAVKITLDPKYLADTAGNLEQEISDLKEKYPL